MAKKKNKSVVDLEEKAEPKKNSKPKEKKVTSVIDEKNVVKGSFYITNNSLKIVAFDASGKRLETTLPLDKNAVDMILS